MERIYESVHQHVVVLEREVALLLDPLSPATRRARWDSAVGGDEAADQLVLELGHRRRGEVDLFE